MTESNKLLRYSELADTSDKQERLRHQLKVLDGLLAAAVQAKKFSDALAITKEADALLRRAR